MSQPIDDEIILEVIDKGLSVLGESPKQAVWYFLENVLKFDRNKVPENIEAFEKALEDLFGLGYGFLKDILRQQLQETTGKDLQAYRTFADCVNGLRQKAENSQVLS